MAQASRASLGSLGWETAENSGEVLFNFPRLTYSLSNTGQMSLCSLPHPSVCGRMGPTDQQREAKDKSWAET